ncbi:MAG: MFS transporter, partial [Chloroflexota bacterium]|nr:MFS transporter [Chloroflexota bacterium]
MWKDQRERVHPRFAGLWRHTDFLKLWTGQTISEFGSLIGGTALQFTAILVLKVTPFEVALLSAFGLVPALLAGPVAGVWVDRLSRRPLLIAADVGRAVLLATIPVAWLLHALRIEHLYVVAFAVGILEILFEVAYRSYLPSLVRREDLMEGNSKLSASNAVAEVGGFGIAGWLVQLLTAPLAILVDAVSFVVSALSVWLIRARETRPEPSGESASMRREIAEGAREVLHHPVLRPLAGCTLILELFGGMYGAVVVLYMVRGLGFEPGILGMIWGVGGASSLLGALLATRLARRWGIGPAMIGCLVLAGFGSCLIPLAEGATLLSAALLIAQQLTGDGAYTAYDINQLSLRQLVAPERLLGRVNASMRFVGLGATLLGTVAGGWLGGAIGLRAT